MVILKALLLAALLVAWSFISKREAKDLELIVFYLLPFVTALVVPPGLTDLAAGLSVGAAFAELPFTLFYSVFSGVFPDHASLRFMRVASVMLGGVALAAIAAYRRDGESQRRFYSAEAMSIVYIVLLSVASA